VPVASNRAPAVSSAARRATYQDVLAAPEHVVAELVDGVLHTQARPGGPHAEAASVLGMDLGSSFHRGRGGLGGWIILDEPELHLGEDVLVPDLAGWRRERLPEVPAEPYFELAPDWVCEVLSRGTALFDRRHKVPRYASARIQHVWLVDPLEKSLELLRLDGVSSRLLATFGGNERVRIEPFDAIELELEALGRSRARRIESALNGEPKPWRSGYSWRRGIGVGGRA
jgi:Uma2 family endonuclease